MKLLVVTLLIAVSYSQAAFLFRQEWSSWKDYHGKTYSTNIEEARRQMAWQDNLMYVTKHNMEAAQGKHTFTVDMNKFADLTNEEWRDMLLREKPLQGARRVSVTTSTLGTTTYMMPPRRSTGSIRDTSPPSKIKRNADLAGLSVLPDHWRDRCSRRRASWCHYQNRTWLIAVRPRETWDATVV